MCVHVCVPAPQVRLAGGIEVLTAFLRHRLTSSSKQQPQQQQQQQQLQLQQVAGVVSSALGLLSLLLADNAANKLAFREGGGFVSCVRALELVLAVVSQPLPPTAAG
jgi:hypothetical protein